MTRKLSFKSPVYLTRYVRNITLHALFYGGFVFSLLLSSQSRAATATNSVQAGGTVVGQPVIQQSPPLEKLPDRNLVIRLKALNKVTGVTDTLRVQPGKPYKWKTLVLNVRACYQANAFEAPETAVFLEIDDNRQQQRKFVFSGWMYASSPAVSAMEHPVYDVWVLSCKKVVKK